MALAETMPTPTLNLIPPDKIDSVVPLIAKHLDSVVFKSRGMLTRDGILDSLRKDLLQLWLIWDGELRAVGATEISTTPSGMKVCSILFLTGENSLDWLHLIEDLEAWARNEGCVRMLGTMRKGWAKRLPDYKMTHIVLEKDLV